LTRFLYKGTGFIRTGHLKEKKSGISDPDFGGEVLRSNLCNHKGKSADHAFLAPYVRGQARNFFVAL